MLTFKVLSALLLYPREDMLEALPDMAGAIERENLLPAPEKSAVLALIETLRTADPLEAQERYVLLFDRGRALSLHIFEHLHGESRGRGQAMADLLELYRSNGFEMACRELPDYIPLFLEYLSRQPLDGAVPLLRNALPVLSLLGARLKTRESSYQAVFGALEALAGEPGDAAAIRQRAEAEGPDDTLVHMDAIWEEEAVGFLGQAESCHSRSPAVSPLAVRPRACAVESELHPPRQEQPT